MLMIDEPTPSTGAPHLTDREMMIIFLLSAGNTTPEIARLLELRPRTVENHKRHIYEKLGVGSQSHAVAKAIWLGLLEPGRPGALGLRRPSRPEHVGEPGRATVAILLGPAGQSRDEVAQRLISEQTPTLVAFKREGLSCDRRWWHPGPKVVVLVDPEPADWSLTVSLSAPAVVVRSGEVPEQLAIADAMTRQVSGLVAMADIATGLGPILSAVAQGFLVMSWGYAETLLKWTPTTSPTVPELTARERDILVLIARGHTIRQTARALGIAAKTVENTQARLFRKLGARNRMEALMIADESGLIDRTALGDTHAAAVRDHCP